MLKIVTMCMLKNVNTCVYVSNKFMLNIFLIFNFFQINYKFFVEHIFK